VADRQLDIVLFGATGFAGQRAAAWMRDNAPDSVRWTIAGRRADALHDVAKSLKLFYPPIVADSSDPASIDAMVRQTKVIASTAGPFAKYGTVVVDACVRNKTHYTDITGESPWVASMIERHHDKAAADGTRIVPMCGFDSVPSDVGAHFLVKTIRERLHQPTREVVASFSTKGGGLNGGTLASVIDLMEQHGHKALSDPFLLCPGTTSHEQWVRHADPTAAIWDPHWRRWLAPFVAGIANTRVVRRSAMLFEQAGEPYGTQFRFQEYLNGGGRIRANSIALGTKAALMLLDRPAGRRLARKMGPAPGSGPDEQAMEGGSATVRMWGRSAAGRIVEIKLFSPGDAGNATTVRFLCCAALCLALEPLPHGGVLTPAFALGDTYVDLLRTHGVQLTVTEPPTTT
jgi:short subunit dehydrogenase-like uncharacterized protein